MKIKMKRIILVLSSFMMLFFIFSCQKDFDNSKSSLRSDRLKVTNKNIPLVNSNSLELKSSKQNREWLFTLVADVKSPTVNNRLLQATHVDIYGDYAFVSYNMIGEPMIGAIDIINISNPTNPSLVKTLEFSESDINILKVVDNGKYLLAGGQDNNGSFIKKWTLPNILFDDNNFGIIRVSGNGITAIDNWNEQVWSLSGGYNGTFFKIDGVDGDFDNKDVVSISNINDGRSVAVSIENETIYILTGNDIFNYSVGSGDLYNLFAVDKDWIQPESKADLAVGGGYLFAALNRGGVHIFDENNGTLIQKFERPITPNGLDPEDFVTNSISWNELLFVANGGAGILVCGTTDHLKSGPFYELGYFDFGGPLSSNFVTSKGNFIFVASGLGGLKILNFEKSGVPDDVFPGQYCETLKNDIINMFPETKNSMELYSHLFNMDKDHRVITETETEVWVQFIWEGAGWKNTFGYYTYELGNEPTSISELNKNVIFPNVSGIGEGGGLESGDMVFIGEFPANTVIGFYLIAQGWNNGLVNGAYTHYTDINLNPNNNQQHLLFLENCCNELVLTFEDIKLPGGDKDFNDIILTIKDNNEGFENSVNSFKLNNVPFVPLCGNDTDSIAPECDWIEETAFVGTVKGGGSSWWYYMDNSLKIGQYPIYAGQNMIDGANVTYVDGILTIDLGVNIKLQEGNETVKIQGYNNGQVPLNRPAAGQFKTYKGNDLIIEIPYYDYFVIHLDVEVCNKEKEKINKY